jgi:RNA polymerase sigma-70 factor, ECF subfamily
VEPSFGIHDLNTRIEAEIPRLRRYAYTLARDQIAADDLVQDCIVRALSKIDLWRYGTNLHAWLSAIMRNEHVNEVRRVVREGASVVVREDEPLLGRAAEQDRRLELRDLHRALDRLPNEQRTAVLLTGLYGVSYKAVADIAGVPVGTIRARVSRARAALRHLTGFGGP